MKKYVFLLAVVFCCRLAYAENLEKFLNSFSDKTGVEKVKIGPLVMKTSGIFTETTESRRFSVRRKENT